LLWTLPLCWTETPVSEGLGKIQSGLIQVHSKKDYRLLKYSSDRENDSGAAVDSNLSQANSEKHLNGK
jgi:hypothetical protein